MRILLIGPLPPPLGGTTVSFAQLVRELREREEVEVVVFNSSRREPGGLLAEAWVALRLLLSLPRLLRRVDVATFHASTRGTVLFGPLIQILCRIQGRPLIVREFGGSFDEDYEKMSPLGRWAVGWLLRRSRFLFQTRSLVDHFEARFPGARLRWYANSRPEVTQANPDTPPLGPARRFVYLGHVKPEKGIRELLQAGRQLQGRDLEIDVFGEFQEGLRPEEFEGNPVVTHRGTLAPDAVIETLRGYDAVVLPTYHFGEGYPGIILEAYLAGRPVVTTRWRSIPEIVEDGSSGILIEPRNAEALASALVALHEASPEHLARLRAGARALASRFTTARWTPEFVEICRSALDESRSG